MITLMEKTNATYLRRLVRAIKAQRYKGPMYLQLACEPDKRRIIDARYRDGLQVRTMGSAMWFPATAEQVSGVCASRETR